MRHDPALVADTQGWLRKAKEDLDIAKELLKPAKTLSGGAVFRKAMNSEKAADYEVPEPTLNATPFEAGVHGQIAVKVIDDRGNELMVVKDLTDAIKV